MESVTDNAKAVVCILMATYNGERYIRDQINSLLAQTHSSWYLLIRDDGSLDETLHVINDFAARDLRINLLHDQFGNVGSCQNFALLMREVYAKYKYFMFCDQDDVWLSFKVEYTLSHFRTIEKQYSSDHRLLVYTNFQYVDTTLQVIQSKKNYNATRVSNLSFHHLLAQNPAYGCTMMFNCTLAEMIKTIPLEAENHDYWIALVASTFGTISYLSKPTIYYRQHDNNASTNFDNNSFRKRFKRIILNKEIFRDVASKVKMAKAFRSIYYNSLSQINKKILDDFICLEKDKSINNLIGNINNGIRRQTIGQTVLFYLAIIFKKQRII